MGEALISKPIGLKIKGFFKLEALKVKMDADGNPVLDKNGEPVIIGKRVLADWFPNLLLTSGRNALATQSNWMNAVQVGTDNTVPTAGDTGLLGFVAGTTTKHQDDFGAQASAPYYGWRRITYRYGVGATAANLSEVGVGWSASVGSNLVTRALIVDGAGDPTTVTPLSDEILDVTYEMRYYPPLVDVTGTVTLDGVSYDYTIRASQVTSSTIWGQNIGSAIGQSSVNSSVWYATDGTLGDITQAPNGVSASCDNADQFNLTYSNNSYQRGIGSTCGPTGWNLGAGIRSLRILTTAGAYQTQFAATSGGATIPKDGTKVMNMQWIIAWSEGVVT
jgi:hypothetical protein